MIHIMTHNDTNDTNNGISDTFVSRKGTTGFEMTLDVSSFKTGTVFLPFFVCPVLSILLGTQ